MLGNIYAQLELRFDLLRATTPKYTSYSYTSERPTEHDTSEAATAIRRVQKKAKKWTYVDVDAAATQSSNATRADIVSKLNEWNENKLVDLQTKGVVNIYRVLEKLPSAPTEQQAIVNALYKDLEIREQQDLERMKRVTNLVTGSACFARTLAQHFGDTLPNDSEECGHCTWCEKRKAVENVVPPTRAWDSAAFFKVLEACPERDDPRFLARVAFGIASPRITSSKLSKHPAFGSMEDHNFTVGL